LKAERAMEQMRTKLNCSCGNCRSQAASANTYDASTLRVTWVGAWNRCSGCLLTTSTY